MILENITGSLSQYKKLEQGTFQHVDQLTAEQRINPQFRGGMFHTADGELYTIQRGECLWESLVNRKI